MSNRLKLPLPEGLSDESIAAVRDVLWNLALEWEARHAIALCRYGEKHRPPFDPDRPWMRLSREGD